MDELLHKKVRIVFNPVKGSVYGIIGTTCTVVGIENGFIIVNDLNNKVSYYAINCIKSITLIESEETEKIC